jgi:Kelch motif
MNAARVVHSATLLPTGKVLVAGGGLASAELFDPAAGSWSATGSLNTARRGQTATLLANGKVLVVGGVDSGQNPLASAELYDPPSGTWTVTGSLITARTGPHGDLAPQREGVGRRRRHAERRAGQRVAV